LKLRSLVAGFDANVSVKDINSTIVTRVSNANLNLKKFSLNKRSTNKRLVSFSSFDVKGISLDTLTKQVEVKDTTLSYLTLNTLRDKDSKLNIQDLVVPRSKPILKKKSKRVKKKEKDYRIKLKKVALKAARINFDDRALNPSVKSKIDRIYLTAYGVDSKKYSWMKYKLYAKVNNIGKIKSNGSVRYTPLKQKGNFELDKISLKELTPYIKEHAYASLDDGSISIKAKTQYEISKNKPDINIDGSIKLEEFFASDSRDNSSLISFNEINLKKFTLEVSPNRLFVDEIDVNSFYVNAMVDANKTMNFATLMKSKNDENITIEDTNATAKIDENLTKPDPFPVKIMKVNVSNGSAQFSDASLPIDFRTDIHSLNGVIYAISSTPNETSYVDIVGEVDKYGSTKLKGSINSSNPKAFTDLSFNFRNLDLPNMSGYSGSFAGYKIDKGKLFLGLNYNIVDSKLIGENSIIIKSIELGDEMKTADGSSPLPLGFVMFNTKSSSFSI